MDTIAFAGGIGENAAPVRQRICEGLGYLGVRLDEGANARNADVISAPESKVSWVRVPGAISYTQRSDIACSMVTSTLRPSGDRCGVAYGRGGAASGVAAPPRSTVASVRWSDSKTPAT